MRKDISGAVMRLEIAGKLIFGAASVPADDNNDSPYQHGKRLFDEAMALLKPAPGTASATIRKPGKSKGEPDGGAA